MIKPKKSVQMMQPYNPPLEGRKGYIRLDFNENTSGPGRNVVKAVGKTKALDLCTYPEYSDFRKRLAAFLKILPSELLITNASDEAIKLVIDTYMEKDEEIIIPVPTFPLFKFYSQVAGVRIKEILYNKDLSFPKEKILESIGKKTKIMVIVNPNSPTGTMVEEKDIVEIARKANHSIILLDEAYCQFSGKSLKKLINKYTNLVIIQTFSKAFGMAALRLGYIISNRNNIAVLKKASSPYSVNTVAMIAAEEAVKNSDYARLYVEEVKKSGVLLKKALRELKIRFIDSKTNFILVDFGKKADSVEKSLKKKGILVRNQSEKPMLKGFIRITFGTRAETKKLISALREAL
ncbi:histidinol-phosphate transaminase [Candidatus Woesearchaeota archaeon]|nr:histidinol-phosphate transaminase [Candidatus Woesearchaeota archaeon]